MELTERDKIIARQAVTRALRKGKLVRPSICSNCRECVGKTHAHHTDYRKPLQIEWLCVECHKEIHRADKPEREWV